jgi:hypothetical protein
VTARPKARTAQCPQTGTSHRLAHFVLARLVAMHGQHTRAQAKADALRAQAPDYDDLPRGAQLRLRELNEEIYRLPRVAAELLAQAYECGLPLDYPRFYRVRQAQRAAAC